MSTLLAMRGTQLLAPVPPQVAAQVNLVNSVTRDTIFTRVSQVRVAFLMLRHSVRERTISCALTNLQSDEKALKTGDDEIVVLNRAANFMVRTATFIGIPISCYIAAMLCGGSRVSAIQVHCEGNADQICIRLDDELTNTAHLTFPVSVRRCSLHVSRAGASIVFLNLYRSAQPDSRAAD